MVAAEDVLCVLCANSFDLHGLLVFVSRRQQATDLAALGVAPAVHLAALSQRKRMLRTGANLLDARPRLGAEDLLAYSDGLAKFL